jgi:hypothetical protein
MMDIAFSPWKGDAGMGQGVAGWGPQGLAGFWCGPVLCNPGNGPCWGFLREMFGFVEHFAEIKNLS